MKTVLLGCSIEPERLKDERIIADMHRYHTIIARESLTYEALKAIGHPRVHLIPDPAFMLETVELPLLDGFTTIQSKTQTSSISTGGTIGINLSPMIIGHEEKAGITLAAYKALISYIIATTDMQIALIPHVVWERNDDRVPLEKLYADFADTGRVLMINDASASELKGYIARLRFFIGARTHATIAAYSSGVPTLTIGYSVKARGIAIDLFGTDENYVLPVQSIESERALIDAFTWLYEHETDIRAKLSAVMPDYCIRAKKINDVITNVKQTCICVY